MSEERPQTNELVAQQETFGELGPAMKALPNEKWRVFVRALVTDTKGYGAITRAARAAGNADAAIAAAKRISAETNTGKTLGIFIPIK